MTPNNPTADELQEALEMAGRWEGEESRLTLSPAENALRAVITLAAAYHKERASREKAEASLKERDSWANPHDPNSGSNRIINELKAQIAQALKERDGWEKEAHFASKKALEAISERDYWMKPNIKRENDMRNLTEEVSALRSRITELEDEAKHRPAWECAKHRTFGPSYLSCAHCAAADPENKEKL